MPSHAVAHVAALHTATPHAPPMAKAACGCRTTPTPFPDGAAADGGSAVTSAAVGDATAAEEEAEATDGAAA